MFGRDAVRRTPNVRATVQEMFDGLRGQVSQNRWPSLAFDMSAALNNIGSPLLCGRFLLQDLHVAEGGLEEGLRAGDPRGGRPWRGAEKNRIRTTMRQPFRHIAMF
jgi:hypothetical protein